MVASDNTLLQTKLHRPRLPDDLVKRSRLIELLNHEINQPLILVCAPAGFVKFTLISGWLEQMEADQSAAAARKQSCQVCLVLIST